jgi:flavin-dependent dehydrogenase
MTGKKVGIIGGGPAGIATAIQLKQYGFHVSIFDASATNKITVGEHLAAEALHEFRKLEIPEKMLSDYSIPCSEVQNAWGQSNIHFNESIFNPFGDSYILSRPDFDQALLHYCEQIGIQVFWNTRVSKVNSSNDGWSLFYANGELQVNFLVDASGRTSKFHFGNELSKKSSKDALIGMTKHLVSDHSADKSHLLVESTSSGWWYTVQIASGKFISTFMTDPKILSRSNLSSSEFWTKALENSTHTRERLDSMEIPSEIFVQSAHSQIARNIVGENWAKVGDAAQSYDPLSSAGIIKGFKMGISCAIAIHNYIRGKANALIEYETEVRSQYQEYVEKRDEYYLKEVRWMDQPFWYHRNLSVKKIQQFSITPISCLNINPQNINDKLSFLENQVQEVDFKGLVNCIVQFSTAKDAISQYLRSKQQTVMNPELMYGLEALKLIGVLRSD